MSAETASVLSLSANGIGLLIVIAGLVVRHRRERHVPLMLTAFGIDLLNLVFVEVRRAAVEKVFATAAGAGQPVLRLHILVSVVVVVCWGTALGTGIGLLRARDGIEGRKRRIHRGNAAVFILARTVNFITSFLV